MKYSLSRRTFAVILSILILTAFAVPNFKVNAQETCVYVSPAGNDSGNGTKSSPYATLAAAFSKLSEGGTVVVMGALSSDVTILNAAVTAKCKNTKRITVTGKDPETGAVYAGASLPLNSPRLYGEMKLEYLNIVPTRNHAFFNTYGNKLIFGEGITKSDFDLYIHGGSYGNTTVTSSDIEISSGSFNTVYMGGAYPTSSSYGVSGNTYLTINGGSISNLIIGFDSSNVNHTEGTINGNVIIRHNGGIINKVTGKRLLNNTVGGYIAIITREGISAQFDLPKAKNGTYFITAGNHGTVTETELAGVFTVTPDSGYYAYVNGKKLSGTTATLAEGQNTIRFLRDTVPGDYEGVLIDGFEDGNFKPQENADRYTVALAAVRTLTKTEASSDYAQLLATLSSKNALPYGWDNASPNADVTKAECIYILASLFDAHNNSKKLFDYADVPDNHIYADAIKIAAGTGKISGMPGDMFYPDATVTRLELCRMLADYFDRIPYDSAKCSFLDVDSADSAVVAAVTEPRTSGKWDFAAKTYVLPASGGTEAYVKALHAQSSHLSPDEIRNASDVIAYKVRQDILSTPNTQDIYDFDDLGITTVYYVSEKNGSDSNDGLSPKTPFKTPNMLHGKIQRKNNVAVLFERGGIYRTGGSTSPLNLAGSKNVVIGSYGQGQKPVVMQSRMNYANAVWTEVISNVYRLDTTKLCNVGVMAFDHDVTDYTDGTFEEIYGEIENMDTQGFTGIEDLNTDLQFYCELMPTYNKEVAEETVDGVKITTTTVTESYDGRSEGYLYLYSAYGNPSERFDSIEIGERFDLVDGAAHGCIIDNISFKFTGAHAIGLATSEDLTVKNCIFSWLGGSILWEAEKITKTVTRSDGSEPVVTVTEDPATGYGNAVEIYGGCDGFYVCDNWIYQIFDDGITNQYHGYDDCIQTDMRYLGNLLEYVYHDFSNCNFTEELIYEKDFPTEGEGAYTDYTSDLVVAYNICRMAGYGWGGPMKNRVNNGQMYRSAGIGANKDEYVKYNIFDSSGGYLIFTSPNANEEYDSNIYIQSEGTRLIGRMTVGNFPFTPNAHRDIIHHVNDTNAVAVIVDSDEIVNCRPADNAAHFSFEGAQIRTDGVQALRFIFAVDKKALEKLDAMPHSVHDKGVGFGAVIMPQQRLDGNRLKKNTLTVSGNNTWRAAVSPAVNIYKEDDERVYFTVCVAGIPESRYGIKFTAIPYLTFEENGADVTVYGDQTNGISLFDMAYEIYNDSSVPYDKRMEMYDILSKTHPDIYPEIEH